MYWTITKKILLSTLKIQVMMRIRPCVRIKSTSKNSQIRVIGFNLIKHLKKTFILKNMSRSLLILWVEVRKASSQHFCGILA